MALSSNIRLSYPQRLFLWLLGYSLLLVGCFVLFQYHREKEFKAEEINDRLQLINAYIMSELDEGHTPAETDLSEFHTFDDIRVSVISPEGKVIYDNSIDSLPIGNHLDRHEIREALETGTGYSVRRNSQSTGHSYFYAARRGDDGRIVRTAVPYSVSLNSLLKADYGFLWVMGAIAGVMCMLGYLATRRVGLHISRLSRFADDVEHGGTISDNEPFPHDELGDISNHIVSLYARLQQANAERDREHRKALREQSEKERIKKQLTNNINHELKTPVATVRLCIETLLAHPELDEKERTRFLERSLANTERLQRLLADVAIITRLDDGCRRIEKEQVDLACIIADVADERRLAAGARGIRITNHVSGPLPVYGNVSLLEAIFNNLIDNAIAYSGGSTVRIDRLPSSEGKTVISLADDGTGVAEEHLPHIFERFYRIDKGRSRVAGGTGLGLAIVKNAVIFHGGTITAENLAAGGLGFRIEIPSPEEPVQSGVMPDNS